MEGQSVRVYVVLPCHVTLTHILPNCVNSVLFTVHAIKSDGYLYVTLNRVGGGGGGRVRGSVRVELARRCVNEIISSVDSQRSTLKQ